FLVTVSALRFEVELALAQRLADPSRHPRDELREMAERERLLVRFPFAFVSRHALEQPARGGHLLVELRKQRVGDAHCRDWWLVINVILGEASPPSSRAKRGICFFVFCQPICSQVIPSGVQPF